MYSVHAFWIHILKECSLIKYFYDSRTFNKIICKLNADCNTPIKHKHTYKIKIGTKKRVLNEVGKLSQSHNYNPDKDKY